MSHLSPNQIDDEYELQVWKNKKTNKNNVPCATVTFAIKPNTNLGSTTIFGKFNIKYFVPKLNIINILRRIFRHWDNNNNRDFMRKNIVNNFLQSAHKKKKGRRNGFVA
jgi:hypothetical protein